MWCCGGLTFTEALLIPTTDKHLVPRLLSMNALDRFIMCSVLATPGAVCQTYPMDLDSPHVSLASLSPSPPVHHPEFGESLPATSRGFMVRALNRPALRLLWHQCLVHVNF